MSTPFEATHGSENTDSDSWKCGDPLKYDMPRGEGDSWDMLLRPMLERDKEQCDAWKDEVGNLLIFAGLFSAIVTAFIIESYKLLQPDPNQAVVAILLRIATTLETPSNATSSLAGLPVTIPDSQAPSSQISRTNIMWFISLVLSLTTVLVGTVSLQWLREHQRYPSKASSRVRFAIFNMRKEGLRDWCVPQVFLLLPMLLQLALVLFLVGLIDFLLLVAPRKVTTPIIVIIALPILFLFLSTITPSLQWIISPTAFYRLFRKIPSQCPYNSPQSSVLTSILTPAILFFFSTLDAIRHPSWSVFRRIQADHLWYLAFHTSDEVALYHRQRCHDELYKLKLLAQRPSDTPETLCEFLPYLSFPGSTLPIYDWITGLKALDMESSKKRAFSLARARCIEEIITLDTNLFVSKGSKGWHQYMQNMLDPWWPKDNIRTPLVQFIGMENVPLEVASEETSMVKLLSLAHTIPEHLDSLSQIQAGSHHELYIRLMNAYITKPIKMPKVKLDASKGTFLSLWSPSPMKYWQPKSKEADDIRSEISQQYTKSLATLFRFSVIQSEIPEDTDILTIFRSYPHLSHFIGIASHSQNSDGQISTLRLIDAQINRYLKSYTSIEVPRSRHLLFYLMACYVGYIIRDQDKSSDDHFLDQQELSWRAEHDVPLIASLVQGLVLQLGNYQEKLGIDPWQVVQEAEQHSVVEYGYLYLAQHYGSLRHIEHGHMALAIHQTPSMHSTRAGDDGEPDT